MMQSGSSTEQTGQFDQCSLTFGEKFDREKMVQFVINSRIAKPLLL